MPIDAVREQVIAGNRHEGGLKIHPCLAVDGDWFAGMQRDVQKLIEQREASDAMDSSHPSNWVRPYGSSATQHNLFNKSGVTSDYSTNQSESADGYEFAAPECDSVKRFFDLFRARLLTFRVFGLSAGSGLGAHEESIVKGEQVRLRFHLPIFTNPDVAMLVDDEKFHFREGYVYFFNNGCVHAAVNEGTSNRYHLIWDMWLDDWIYETMLDSNSPAAPGPGLRKLTAGEIQDLGRGETYPIAQYIIGTPTGELILARKLRTSDGASTVVKKRLTEGRDIVSEDSFLDLGTGWYPVETYAGETFRWVNDDAVFTLAADDDGTAAVSVELEGGPSLGNRPLSLTVTDGFGCGIQYMEVTGRQTLKVSLPVHSGPCNTFHLRAVGGGVPVPGDPRILNFRVFRIGPEVT